jgi:putative toxin-antitoxin system antitoxin component (TIGR02293 family)
MESSALQKNIQFLTSYSSTDDQNTLKIIKMIRKGIIFNIFQRLITNLSFSEKDWSNFLHLSERTLQRYKKDKKTFDPVQSEKIIEIILLYNKGINVFGEKRNFDIWLETENISLGREKPKNLLDTTFGITMIKDELIRIEHGTFA